MGAEYNKPGPLEEQSYLSSTIIAFGGKKKDHFFHFFFLSFKAVPRIEPRNSYALGKPGPSPVPNLERKRGKMSSPNSNI